MEELISFCNNPSKETFEKIPNDIRNFLHKISVFCVDNQMGDIDLAEKVILYTSKITIFTIFNKLHTNVTSNILIEDIAIFQQCGTKDQNDALNKKRELILLNINNNDMVKTSYFIDTIYGENWKTMKKRWNELLESLYEGEYDEILIQNMGGRQYNYDFNIYYKKDNFIFHEVKVEFKFNFDTIAKLPQFLSLSERTSNVLEESYSEFFYDNYLPKIVNIEINGNKLDTLNVPLKEDYLKMVGQTNYNIHPLFTDLYNLDKNKNFNKQKSDIVDESISDFLSTYASTINLSYLKDKFKATQMDKIYVMWDCKRQVFHKEEIKLTSENLVYMGVINKNTIIVQSDLNYFKLLLRWKITREYCFQLGK